MGRDYVNNLVLRQINFFFADNKYHVGTRLQLDSDLKFELTGTQETDTQGTLIQQIKLDGAFNW